MYQPDNWGWRGRLGMFIVSHEAIPEAEWWAMMPPDVSVHAARITAKTPWAAWNEARDDVTLSTDLAHGAEQFAAMKLRALVTGHSSSSFIGGKGWDAVVAERLSEIVGADVAVTTNGLDCVAALDAVDVRRPFLVMPPWFNDTTVAAGERYYADHGFEPAAVHRYDPGEGWRDKAPGELIPGGLGMQQQLDPLFQQIRANCPAEADGVLIAGTGFRCVGLIEALEEDLVRPVVTANQASLWHCLRLSGIRATVEGYGELLRD